MANDRELPSILGFRMEPWINLLHAIGLPWAIIGVSVWYGVPWAKTMSDNIQEMKEETIKMNKKLSDVYSGAHALEVQINKTNSIMEETSKSVATNTLLLKTIQSNVKDKSH